MTTLLPIAKEPVPGRVRTGLTPPCAVAAQAPHTRFAAAMARLAPAEVR